MTLSPGFKIASYEIVEPIGAGGMGEVYRAHDTRLDRDVAVKVLPESLAEDPERLARFEREAKLLAALNHPGIATLHGLERADGQPVLVMELVEGETLAERIARGALALDEAVALSGQIADALGAAHAKGIVHRDLKPPNVKLTPDGKVKVLDFGLAKLAEPDTASGKTGASQSPTLTKNTALGAILGTASYMSPEQARGKAVDKRTDIWAFGCCLFEAIAGRKAYDGETVADVLSKVLQREPEWSALPARAPAPMRRLLERCLDKDPTRRFQDIGDARFELEESLTAAPRETSRASWLVLVPAVVLTALVTWLLLRPTPAPVDVKRFSINLAPGDEFIVGGIEGPLVTISPDGSKVVYAGLRDGVSQLFLRRIDEAEPTPIAGTRDGRTPFFSPDGGSLGFSRNARLERVTLAGGPPTMIGKNNNFGGSWSRTGRIVFPSVDGTFHVPADGGPPTEVSFDGDGSAVWPNFLPDGSTVLFGSAPTGPSDIVAVSLETGEARVLIENGNYPCYAASGHLLFARGDAVFAAPFDAERVEVSGAAVPVLTGVSRGGSGEASFDVSEDGTLVYVAELRKPESGLVWVDRGGDRRPVGPRRRATWSSPRVSPNGELIAAMLEPLLGVPDVWLLDTEAETLTRLSSSGALTPAWEPAGDAVLFQFYSKLWRQSIDSADPDTVGVECDNVMSVSVTGEFILCEANDRLDIELVRLEEGGAREPLLDSQFNEHSGALSPDERWLAFVSDESGEDEVYVQPFPGPGRKRRVSTGGGSQPVWSRDGHELFYRNGLDMNAVTVSEEGVPGEPELLFSGNFESTFTRDPQYDVSLDGQRFLMIERAPRDEHPESHVVLNWLEELKRLVP